MGELLCTPRMHLFCGQYQHSKDLWGKVRRILEMYRSSLLLTFVLSAVLLPAQTSFIERRSPQPPEPSKGGCAAFLESGNVHLECDVVQPGASPRQSILLTDSGDVKSWGISTDTMDLGLVKGLPGRQHILELIDLQNGRIKRSEPTDRRTQVVQTCGTLVLREYRETGPAPYYSFRDLIDEKEITVPPATLDIRCSTDKKYRLRLGDLDDLYLESAGKPSLLAKGIVEFNISPNGNYIAYSDGYKICAGTREAVQLGRQSCLDMVWTAGPMKVADDGLVVFTEQTSQACSNDSQFAPCPAIFSWRAGDANDQLLKFNSKDLPLALDLAVGEKLLAAREKWASNVGVPR